MPPIYTVPVLPVVSLPLSSSRERSVRPSCGGNRNYTGTERETRHGGRVMKILPPASECIIGAG